MTPHDMIHMIATVVVRTNLLVKISEVVHGKNHPGAGEASACQVRELEPEPGAESPGVGDSEDEPGVLKPRASVVPRIQGILREEEKRWNSEQRMGRRRDASVCTLYEHA